MSVDHSRAGHDVRANLLFALDARRPWMLTDSQVRDFLRVSPRFELRGEAGESRAVWLAGSGYGSKCIRRIGSDRWTFDLGHLANEKPGGVRAEIRAALLPPTERENDNE